MSIINNEFVNFILREYLANFKKTVAMHQVFLQRIASHPFLRNDYGFRVFLEYDHELSVRTKNAKEKVGFVAQFDMLNSSLFV